MQRIDFTFCEDALRLGRIVAGLLPAEPEVHLVALMEIQASRSHARIGPA
jgi:predicted RNA polymerase sigma factor